MRSLFITLFLLLPGLVSSAQQTGKTGEVSSEVREMQQVEDRWDEAITKRDQYAMELVLAPQFIGISASGDVVNRNQQIAHLFVKNEGPLSLEQKVVSVRVVGEVAIVNGTYVMTWKGEKGPILEKGIFSHVFEHVRNTWLCLNSQRTVVAEETKGAAATEKPKAKRSDAALPMHVPLVYKGPDSTQPPPAPGTNQPPQ
jgi:ketosteroid isomerase-like protein